MTQKYLVVDSKAILPTLWPLNYISVTNKIVNLVVSKSKTTYLYGSAGQFTTLRLTAVQYQQLYS